MFRRKRPPAAAGGAGAQEGQRPRMRRYRRRASAEEEQEDTGQEEGLEKECPSSQSPTSATTTTTAPRRYHAPSSNQPPDLLMRALPLPCLLRCLEYLSLPDTLQLAESCLYARRLAQHDHVWEWHGAWVMARVIFFIRDESFAAPAPKTGAAAADAGGGVGSGGGGQSAAATPGQSDGGGASGAPLPLPSLSSSAAATATGGGGGGGGGNPFAASVDVPEGNGVKGRGGVKLAVLDQALTRLRRLLAGHERDRRAALQAVERDRRVLREEQGRLAQQEKRVNNLGARLRRERAEWRRLGGGGRGGSGSSDAAAPLLLRSAEVQLAALLGDYKSATAALSDCGGAVEGARDSLEGSKHSAQGAARALERVEGVVRSMARARDGARWVRAPVS